MSQWHDLSLDAMGCSVHLRTSREADGPIGASAALARAASLVRELDAEWSRFSIDSALSRLNASTDESVHVGKRLASAVASALEAAEASNGLVDPTMGAELRALGYDRTFDDLQAARPWHPPRAPRPAKPDPAARWRSVTVDVEHGAITRPAGVEIDLGGIGKGLAADMVVELLSTRKHVLADLGGDMVRGGTAARETAQAVDITGPEGDVIATFELHEGAIATSGVTRRAWAQGPEVHHHILDPSRHRPAHTGLIQVSALAPTGIIAERRAKQALLAGPKDAPDVLTDGGVLVHEGGRVELLARDAVSS